MCYVGIKACGCIVAVVVDRPEWVKDTAKDVAAFIMRGLTVERMKVSETRTMHMGCKCQPSLPLEAA